LVTRVAAKNKKELLSLVREAVGIIRSIPEVEEQSDCASEASGGEVGTT